MRSLKSAVPCAWRVAQGCAGMRSESGVARDGGRVWTKCSDMVWNETVNTGQSRKGGACTKKGGWKVEMCQGMRENRGLKEV